ncbi:NAD(P)H-dependent oxidoreductase [Dethiothermospora halolimnae]|uniref:NAD(P)H-dependent oxidoreductase n=1 Tax=Dethiothermospora halolimnae TaxID=3114390 RepID=UPI003CCBA527
MDKKKILLLNGSNRKKKTSYSFAKAIKDITADKGHEANIIHIIDYFNQKEDFNNLKNILIDVDVIGIISPLYVDTLPYTNIWFFEKLSNELRNQLKGKSFFAIAQSGFIDIKVCKPLIESCRFFAKTTEMKWLGGLSYGGGAVIDGMPINELGKRGEKIIAGFTILVEEVLKESSISYKAQDLITFKMPKILYRPLAMLLNHNNKKFAKDNGVRDIKRKVYIE